MVQGFVSSSHSAAPTKGWDDMSARRAKRRGGEGLHGRRDARQVGREDVQHVELADEGGALEEPELAARRWNAYLALHGAVGA